MLWFETDKRPRLLIFIWRKLALGLRSCFGLVSNIVCINIRMLYMRSPISASALYHGRTDWLIHWVRLNVLHQTHHRSYRGRVFTGQMTGVRTLRQQDTSAAGHFGSRGILPKCPDTSAAQPMCLMDSSAVQPKCLMCVCDVLSSVDGRYAYILQCTFSYCIYSIPGVNTCSCLS